MEVSFFVWCCRSTSTDCRMRVYMNAMCLLAAACQVLCSRCQRDSQRGSDRRASNCVCLLLCRRDTSTLWRKVRL